MGSAMRCESATFPAVSTVFQGKIGSETRWWGEGFLIRWSASESDLPRERVDSGDAGCVQGRCFQPNPQNQRRRFSIEGL